MMMFLPVFTLVLLCQTARSFSVFRSDDVDADFNLFVFTQWWPQTLCYDQVTKENFRRSKVNGSNEACVPEGITKWTIHGLWPTVGTEHKPVFCNDSWPFSESVIQDLETKLEHQWPTLESGHESAEFWKHEWEKHGTCSTNIPYLNSEHKYFSVTLSLNDKYDLYSILKQSGIVPSDKRTYQVRDILDALFNFYQVRPKVACYDGKELGQMLDSVELCLDKHLSLIDCLDSTTECDFRRPVQYPPIINPNNLM